MPDGVALRVFRALAHPQVSVEGIEGFLPHNALLRVYIPQDVGTLKELTVLVRRLSDRLQNRATPLSAESLTALDQWTKALAYAIARKSKPGGRAKKRSKHAER